ncbi:ribosomal maturation YjgA family protein [Flavobacterium silvaticum]|uniref:DUF2809 domain-containing protein n=1 Tax=Flavobacterium silvaticum TaxID=1852020 RepID=A0A972FQA9_9FLAO|nr:DUF2809 domain-containing protein [Flavobacterium silvaticum]NMH29395.1 DUF2809 domain-containing protein [Flavobacterium silvaticum]
MSFSKNYFAIFVVLFAIEACIALFVHDGFIRPYVGDVLVVMLIYGFVKSFIELPVITAVVCVLAFAFCVEFLQYLNIVDKLGLSESPLARTVIGTSFSWNDLLCYTIGCLLIVASEKNQLKKQS